MMPTDEQIMAAIGRGGHAHHLVARLGLPDHYRERLTRRLDDMRQSGAPIDRCPRRSSRRLYFWVLT